MRPEWEKGWRGRVYAAGRRVVPLAWRRAIRRRLRPERFLGIHKPAIDVPRFDFDPAEIRPGRPDVLFLPVIAWTYRRQRPQQLAEALSRRGKRVFYGALAGDESVEEPTAVAPGVSLLPIRGVRREDPADRRLEGRALEEAVESLAQARSLYELYEVAMIVETPFWTPLALILRDRFGWTIVYDCLDEHSGFSTNRGGILAREEEALVPAADLVVATSEPILERLRLRNERSVRIANGCDFDVFSAVPDRRPAPAAPTVGYVGAIDEWFDAALFDRLTGLRPHWRFELVGGAEGAAGGPRIAARANVVFHGEKPHAELPALRSRFDVEVIPFRLTPLTHAVDPVKLYEAAAAGRPTVATPMRSLSALAAEGVVRLAGSAEDFVAAIEAAVAEPAEADRRRRAFAKDNTWDARAAELDARLRGLYPLVSIVIPVWNGLHWTRLCLESLDRRTDWPSLEIVVADNGSTDGTPEFLREEAARRPAAEFRVLSFAENRGFAAAVNAACRTATGEYLCLLNNDTVVTRGWLSALVAHLRRDPDLGMVGASTNEIANAARVEVGYRDATELEAWARRFTTANAGRIEPIRMLAMFCVLLPRNVWEDLGPLDERFSVGMFEDNDYAERLRASGRALGVARDAFVHHWGRGSFRELPEQEYLRIHRENRELFQEKWGLADPSANSFALWRDVARLAEESRGLVVFPPSIGWDITLVQRPHHLARAFAGLGFVVLFQIEATSEASAGLREIEPRLFVGSVSAPALREAKHAIFWAFAYNVPTSREIEGSRLVYDVIDHLDVFPQARSLLRFNEARALRDADAVFAVSRVLLDEVQSARPDVVYLPNGVDAARFAAPADVHLIPEPLRRASASGRPVAGFVGAMARWVDAELLRDLARYRPDWEFLLFGEVLDGAFPPPSAFPSNLRLAGSVSHAAIPSVLSAFHAGLIPFRLEAEGLHASPIKLYEYLAAGLPVISTPIPECAAIPEVAVGATAAEFAALLDVARANRESAPFQERARARGRENDWSKRAVLAIETLEKAGGRRSLG